MIALDVLEALIEATYTKERTHARLLRCTSPEVALLDVLAIHVTSASDGSGH
jgi:hypothetical protein